MLRLYDDYLRYIFIEREHRIAKKISSLLLVSAKEKRNESNGENERKNNRLNRRRNDK